MFKKKGEILIVPEEKINYPSLFLSLSRN